jgi:putative drug exporter of the RND superfamily
MMRTAVRFSTESLARACALHPWRTVAAWITAVVLSIGIVAALLGDTLTTEGEVTSDTDSKRAEELVLEHFPPSSETGDATTEAVIVSFQSGTVDRERVQALAEELRRLGATNVVTSADEGQERLDSEDGSATALLVGLGRNEDSLPDLVETVNRLDEDPAVEAAMTGELTIDEDFGTLSEEDLQEGELFFGAPAALIVLLLVFGTVVAGVIPLVLALLSIAIALALTAVVGQAFELSVFVTNMIFGMGLALGIDYSLFILSRFREERSQRREKLDAIVTSGATASRAVLFSGAAFVLAMTGLELVPNTIMRSLATGAILVGIVSVAAALTLLPAVISLLGDRVESLRLPYFGRTASAGAESRFWGRIVRAVLRRPVVSLVAAVGLLLAAAVPVLSLESGTAGISTLPDRFESKQGFLLLNREFPGQTTDPVSIVVQGDSASPEVRAAVDELEAELGRRRIFGDAATETSPDGGLIVLTVPVAGDSVSAPAVDAVRDLREDVIPTAFAGSGAEAFVGGATAEDIDYYDVMDQWLPIVLVFVLGLSFILLTIAFRSIVVPATAIAMNLLSVGAAYGLLVLVFVEGVGNELFGFQQVDIVEAWVPLFLFAVLFGLSMDYQVFLLSRIRERYTQTGSNEDAVSFGVGSTARLITGAALIIIAVFAGFARGDLVMFQQMGFGVAVALLIDATIIRSVVVPATMKLLGRWNWYLPSWLSWLPDVHVEGHEEELRPRRAT